MNAAVVRIYYVLKFQLERKKKKSLMTKIEHVCFDLDGTLVRSGKTIYKTTISTLKQLGIDHILPEAEFNMMIGQHFKDIFSHFSIDVPDFDYFIRIYKNNYFDFMNESELYEGVKETLKFLKSNNIKVSLLTTKAQDQAEKIIAHFNIDKYFDLIVGRRDGIAHKPSPEPLLIICNELNIEPSQTLMVGDTELDILCGKSAGSKTCAVTFGYREPEVLKNYSPDYLINSLAEISQILD